MIRLTAIMQSGSRVGREIERDRVEVRRQELRQAMEDSLQIIMQSTLMGYIKRESPDGTPWASNAPWYAEMKGGAAPNTGPVSRTIMGGPFRQTHEFERVNIKRMKNSLMKENNVTSGVVRYEEQARERARLTQYGGTSEFAIVSKSTGGRMAWNVQSMERPHLGVATYPRIFPRTDDEWIEYYFGEQVEISVRDTLGT